VEYRQRSNNSLTLFKKMRIGELCQKTELTKDTIRFYEKKGLLKVKRSTSPYNNYKEYTFYHLERLELIKKAKRFGFTLNEITALLELFDAKKANCSTLKEKLTEKITDIDRRIEELKDFKSSILKEIKVAQDACKGTHRNGNCSLAR